jgi:hypothetical protein
MLVVYFIIYDSTKSYVGVGKSSIGGKSNVTSTIAFDMLSKTINLDDKILELKIVDTVLLLNNIQNNNII